MSEDKHKIGFKPSDLKRIREWKETEEKVRHLPEDERVKILTELSKRHETEREAEGYISKPLTNPSNLPTKCKVSPELPTDENEFDRFFRDE